MLTSDHVTHMADEVDEDMMNAFKVFDKDGDGYIDRDELIKVMTMLGK